MVTAVAVAVVVFGFCHISYHPSLELSTIYNFTNDVCHVRTPEYLLVCPVFCIGYDSY